MKYIAKCVTSVIESDYPEELLTIYVCDGKSMDGTLDIVHDLEKNNPNVFLLINKKETTPYALNLGIQNSVADICIILGAHSEASKDYVGKCVEAFQINENIGCAGGIIENVYENKTSEIIGIAMSSKFGVGNAYFRTGGNDGYVDTVAFGAYKREVFDKAGYFDTDLTRNQDDEFNFRIGKAGYKIYLSNSIRSKYYVRGSFSKLFRQYFQYGYWKVVVNVKHKTITTARQLAPLFLVCYFIFGLIVSIFSFNVLVLYLAGTASYLLLLLIFSSAQSKNLNYILQIAFAFLILHVSYGLGYLSALVNIFVLRNNRNTNFDSLTR